MGTSWYVLAMALEVGVASVGAGGCRDGEGAPLTRPQSGVEDGAATIAATEIVGARALSIASPEPRSAGPEPPIAARTVPVPGDLEAFYVPARRAVRSPARMVFLHGACTHGLGYIQAFQFTASERGPLMALQGEHACGGGYRSWTGGPERTDARIDAAFRAAGDRAPDAPVVAIGYSQGALVAAGLAAKYPAKYRRIVLIGSPRAVDARALAHLDGAVMMAGTFDNRAVMKESADALKRAGVPATFIEIPKAHHGQLLDGEKVMNDAFAWLEQHAKNANDASPPNAARADAPPNAARADAPPNAARADAPPNAAPPNSASVRDASPARLAPLGDAAWIEPLDLGNGDFAVVTVPLGATEPRPLMLAVHGAGDRPEWACGGWRLGTNAYPFIVCPRGTPLGSNSYAWSSWQQIERIALSALDHVRRRFGAYIAEGPVAYAGFSQGATAAAPLLLRHASDFHPIILAEGAYASTTSADFARSLANHGARTIILVCGTAHCFANAARARPILERAKLTVFVGGDASSGHNLNLAMQNALRRSWKGWFAAEPAWSGFLDQANE
ncbi:hypothetical protein [Pendulispora albinea]|uniref:Uncharacterized protein n=1 Tax=Pendulispora albinea TaxID=2741071 RepID=A0ABZ2MCC9_9BACT